MQSCYADFLFQLNSNPFLATGAVENSWTIQYMPSNSDVSNVRSRTAPPAASLRCWPLRDEPLQSWCVLGLAFVLAIVSGQVSGRWGIGVGIFAAVLAASWQLWMPMSFELGPKGVIRSTFIWRRRIAWSEFSRYECLPHGVFLRHCSDQMALDAVSGLFLPSQPPHTELLAVVDYYLKPRISEAIGTTQTMVHP